MGLAALLKAVVAPHSRARASALAADPMKTLRGAMAVPRMPPVVDLRKGYPRREEWPREVMAKACGALGELSMSGDLNLGYFGPHGSLRFREQLQKLVHAGDPSAPAHESWLFTTVGVSHAIELLTQVLTRPGDAVLCENPTYFLAGQIFRDHGLRIHLAPTDANGLRVDAVEQVLAAGLRPKMVYTVPSHANPTGSTLPEDRRERLAALAREYRFWVVGDEAYHLLRWGEGPLPNRMATFDWRYTAAGDRECPAGTVDDGGVASIGSISKVLSPACRVGWVEGPPVLVGLLAARGWIDSGGGPASLTSELIAAALAGGGLQAHLAVLKAAYAERCAALCAALRDAPVDFRFTQPRGGYFVWVRLPDDCVDAAELEPFADHEGVRFLPGDSCSATAVTVSPAAAEAIRAQPRVARAGPAGDAAAAPAASVPQAAAPAKTSDPQLLRRHIRLCFAQMTSAELREGVQRLTRAVANASSQRQGT